MNIFKKYFSRDSFIRKVFTLFSGSAGAQFLIIATAPILSRLFTPEEFGIYYLFIGVGGLISLIITGGFEKAYVIIESDRIARQVLFFTCRIILFSFIIILFTALLLKDYLTGFFNTRHSTLIVLFIPFYTTLFAFFRVFQHWLIRENKYKNHSGSNIVRSVVMTGGQTISGASGASGLGLISGAFIAQVASVLYLLSNKTFRRQRDEHHSWSELKTSAKKYIAYPKFFMPSGLINEASLQLPIFALKFFFSTVLAGLYSLPHKVLSQPSRLLGYAVGEVYYRSVSDRKENSEEVALLTFRVFKVLVLISVLPFGILTIWGESIFSFVFGPEWAQSGILASYLSPWVFLVFAGSPISYIFNLKDKLALSFKLNSFLFIGRTISLLLGFLIYGTLVHTIIFFAVFSFLFEILTIVISLRLAEISNRKIISFGSFVLLATIIPWIIKILINSSTLQAL